VVGDAAEVPVVSAHVIVDDDLPGLASDSSVALGPEDAHHLASVLRLRPGEPVGVTDGRGGYVLCSYAGGGRVSPLGPVTVAPPRQPVLTVGFVPVKGDRPEWAVQKLTELGVDRIVLLTSARAVVRWEGARLASHLERLRRVARSAVMQSRQVWVPAVDGVVPVGEMGAGGRAGGAGGAGGVGGVALADAGGGRLAPAVHTVLVGPEGGWTEQELDRFGHGAVRLGAGVLRTETAAVAAGVLLTARRAELVS
jgi:16S rRNA (uracil1498-N3)-methyltransferase